MIHSDDKTIMVGVAGFFVFAATMYSISSWRDVQVARATGKAPEADSVRLSVKLGDGAGGSP